MSNKTADIFENAVEETEKLSDWQIFLNKSLAFVATGMELENLKNLIGDQVLSIGDFLRWVITNNREAYQLVNFFNHTGYNSAYKVIRLAWSGPYITRDGPLTKTVDCESVGLGLNEVVHTVDNIPASDMWTIDREDERASLIWSSQEVHPETKRLMELLHKLGYIQVMYHNYYMAAYVKFYNKDIELAFPHLMTTTRCLGHVTHLSKPNLDLGCVIVGETQTHSLNTLEVELRWSVKGDHMNFNLAYVWYSWAAEDEAFMVEDCDSWVKVGDFVL